MTIKILIGDVFEQLATLPDDSIDCCVTSPPYWGLRDYGVPGQIGLEPSLGEHIEVIVNVFDEIKRVLKPTGTCWLNYGDGFFHSGCGSRDPEKWPKQSRNDHKVEHSKNGAGLKPKDLLMMPNRIAIALQDAGWWVRSEIIWHKPNPMPESVIDRPSSAHEKIFLLTKSARYFYDADAVRTPSDNKNGAKAPDGWDTGPGAPGSVYRKGREKGRKNDKQRGHGRRHAGFNDRWDAMSKEEQQAKGANLRNVWTIPTQPFSDAHFATFPPALIEPCIKAGCPKGGTVLDPFGGAGTSGLVADRLGRDAILIELNPEYVEIAERRLTNDAGMFSSVETTGKPMRTSRATESVK